MTKTETEATLKRLGDIVEFRKGKKPSSLTNEPQEGSVPYIDIEAFEKGNIRRYTDDPSVPMSDESKNVLMVWDGARSGLVGRATGAIGSTLMKISSKELISDFLYYFLASKYREINTNPRGTGIPHVNPDLLWDFPVAMLSISDQEEAVKTIRSVEPLVNDSRERIEKLRIIIKKLRRSILSAAVTGRLTEDWRSTNVEHEKLYINYQSQTKKVKVQFDISNFDCYELPEDWQWRQFWEVAEIRSNLVNPNDYKDFVLVAPDNIERGTGRLLEKKLVKDINPISPKHLFSEGQIVYSKIRPYLSKLIYADFDGLCSADMYPISSRLNTQYLMLYMLSPYFLEIVSNIGTRTLLPKTNQEELNSIPVPVPSLEEQEEIVKRARQYLDMADEIERQIEKASRKMASLLQSVFKTVFDYDQAAD